MNEDHEYSAHLLLVGDKRASTLLLKSVLGRDHHITLVADDLRVQHLLSGQAFDLVLVDMDMPDFDGLALLKRIRDKKDYEQLPVILISDSAEGEAIARGLEAGASDYLTKPLDRHIVQARVEMQLKHKRLADAHRKAIEELKHIQQMRDRFFNTASHDLKNPINNMRMALFLLHSLLDDNPGVRPLLDNINLALNSMQDIVRDFLDTAALQGQELDLQLSCVSVETVLWEVAMQFDIAAHKKQITLKVAQSDGEVMADMRRLTQILSNLVSNAIKYSPPEKPVILSSAVQDDYVRISVVDRGPGIPPEERDLLFSEFGKLSTRPTAGESSTGLGLWIVKQLVALQNGRVGVETPPEGGSIFWVELPVWRADEQAESSTRPNALAPTA